MSDQQKLKAALKEIGELKAALKVKQSKTDSNRLAAIVDSYDDAIISKDLNSIIITWNKGAEKIYGYSADEMVGASIIRLIPTDRQGEENYILGKIKNGKNVEHFETRRQTKDGRLIDVSVTASPIKDATGKIIGASKVARDISRHKQAEESLRRSHEKYMDLFDNAPVGFHEVDGEGRLSRINKTELKMLGYAAEEELLGQFVWKISADQEASRRAVFTKLAGTLPPPEGFQRILRRKDGTIFPVLINDRLLRQGDGKVTGLLAAIQDITKHQKAESALLEEQTMFRNLADTIPDKIYFKDRESRFIRINEALTRHFGLRNAVEALGKTDYAFLGKEHAKQAYEDEQEIMRTGLPIISKEEREVWNDGRVTWASSTKLPMRDPTGKITGIMGISRDITEHKKAEEETRWKTALLEAQVNSSPDGILVVDNEGKKVIQNQRLNDLWKIPQHIAENHDDAAQVKFVTSRTTDPKRFLDKVTHLYSHPEEVSRDEIKLVDGTILDRYSSPICDKSGKLYGRIWSFRDITEQRKLEEQFRQSQKMEAVGQLAGGVAHDFNNILAVIEMQSSLLKNSGDLSASQLEYAEEISITIQRAAALTRQLLLFSRREVFQPRDLDLNETLAATTKMLRRVLGENIQMQLKLPSQPMFINADAGMMDQILLNLVVNARDAMPNGGHLLIEISGVEFDDFAVIQSPQARPGSFVRLNVSDSGCGIPAEILPKIFEPFFTTKDVGKGTGLGLATVFGIVQQHQGWINVYSEVNHGTTFRIYLPRLAKNGGKKSPPLALANPRGGHEMILLAEDDSSLRAFVCKALSQLGYRIIEAPDGAKALEIWKENRDEIRLLLTDLVMPHGMSGKDLAQRILQENPKLKVIYMSGYSAEVVGKDFPLNEDVNFLTKPFQASKLAQAIRDSLDKSA